MAEKGGQPGNNNAGKNKPWADALRRLIARDDRKGLDKLADKVYEMAEEGDLQAIKEIGDRLDGRAVQGIANETEQDWTITVNR